MKKIMYIQSIPWSWIKQRPQFIAEELSDFYKVDVYFKKAYKKTTIVDNHTSKVNLTEIFRLPFERYMLVETISNYIVGKQLIKKINDYDFIWVSDPRIYIYISKHIKKEQKIIFDCMDDYAEFNDVKRSNSALMRYKKAEFSLLRDCDICFVSSGYLKKVLIERNPYVAGDKIHIVNNAISKYKLEDLLRSDKMYFDKQEKEMKIATYIGTISSWMDFNLILESLKYSTNVVYYFYGPVEIDIPSHDKIVYKGILKHDQIFNIMRNSNMLIMPFKLNKLVLSVDPVKIYEYISVNVPVVAINYGETEKFKEFVYLYKNKEEYFSLIKALEQDQLKPLATNYQIKKFLLANTWEKRVEDIKKHLV